MRRCAVTAHRLNEPGNEQGAKDGPDDYAGDCTARHTGARLILAAILSSDEERGWKWCLLVVVCAISLLFSSERVFIVVVDSENYESGVVVVPYHDARVCV